MREISSYRSINGIKNKLEELKLLINDAHAAIITIQETKLTPVKHATHKTNISINRATHKIQGFNITLTTSQVQEAIKQSKYNKLQGPDKLNSRHRKHIGPLGLAFLTSMLKTALDTNIILHIWKLANIVPKTQ